MNLTKKSWSLGWLPSDDKYNGRKDGLARMENLQLDENGIVSLCKAYNKINASNLSGYVHSCYSKYLGTKKWRFVGLGDRRVLADPYHGPGTGNFAVPTNILTGGNANRAAFGFTYDQVLACSGGQRKRFDGTTVRKLGIDKPSYGPLVEATSISSLDVSNLDGGDNYTNWELASVGENLINTADYVQWDTSPESAMGVVQTTYATPKDTLSFGGGTGTDDDVFSFQLRLGDTSKVSYVRLEVLMWPPGEGLTYPADYYHYTWNHNYGENTDSPIITGINEWSKLEVKRSDFKRLGNSDDRGWDTIYAIRVTVQANSVITNVAVDFRFTGTSLGPLSGWYEYVQQDVYNSGVCLHKSPLSEPSVRVYIKNGYFNITPNAPYEDVNEVWIYRRAGEVNVDVTPVGEQPMLDKWYRVLVISKVGGVFPLTHDHMSDADALELNLVGNSNLLTVNATGIKDNILGIVTNYFTRAIYLTYKDIFLSEPENPDAVDTLASIKLSGSTSGINLWIRKVGEQTLYIGTSEDIYSVSGTLATLQDGSIDAFVRPFGVAFPPLSSDVAVDGSTVFYLASDGWRSFSNGSTQLISEQLNLLFNGETRYERYPVSLLPLHQITYPCAIAKGKLFTSNYSTNGTRPLFVYDFVNSVSGRPNYWYLYNTNPICLFTEEDGKLLGGYGSPGDYFLREMDVGTLVDGTEKLGVTLETFYDDDEKPRNRKDTFTYKITLNTGGSPATIRISKDGLTWQSLGTFSPTTATEYLTDISSLVGLGFRFAVRITGSFSTFKLYNHTIEYDPRPEQLNYLRIPNTNLGTFCRKRFTNYAFVIDTLGNAITFTPLLDNVVQDTSTPNYAYRGTHSHYFTSDTVGVDIGGILSGGIFEFYQVLTEEIVSEKLPIPVKYLLIPANDYGSPNRKRHSSYKFSINTRGADVTFIPRLDGVGKTSSTVNTSEKRIHEHFFSEDTIAKDIGGTLVSTADTPFEFYGVIIPQDVEVLPPRLKEFKTPVTNYGIASKKRIRTMPMLIDTNGYDVTFTPLIDGITGAPSIIRTVGKTTGFHYFTTDIFGIDFSGELVGVEPFEFYGLLKPEEVEAIPVGKKFDQIGPVHFVKLGKLIRFRLRVIPTTSFINYEVFMEDTSVQTGTIKVVPYVDGVYEVMLPKSKNGTICRITFRSF